MDWKRLSNEDMALHLDLWLDLDGRVETETQVAFFKELIWRLRLTQDRRSNDGSSR